MSDYRRPRAPGCRVWPDEQGRWPDVTHQVSTGKEQGGRAERAAGGREDARRKGTCWRESLPQQARAPASSTAHECSAPAHTDRKAAVAPGCAAALLMAEGTGLAACGSKSRTRGWLGTGFRRAACVLRAIWQGWVEASESVRAPCQQQPESSAFCMGGLPKAAESFAAPAHHLTVRPSNGAAVHAPARQLLGQQPFPPSPLSLRYVCLSLLVAPPAHHLLTRRKA